ncbi:hypothetical protein AgCh_002409 [Apium graveolens]
MKVKSEYSDILSRDFLGMGNGMNSLSGGEDQNGDLYAFIIGSYVIWTVVTWCFSFDVWVVAGCLYHKNAPFESSKSVVDKDANTKKKNKSTDRSTASTAPLNKGNEESRNHRAPSPIAMRLKKDLQVSENLGNGLLNMYVKSGDMDSAEKLFDEIDMKTVFSWMSMIEGYMQKGDWESASVFFDRMPEKDVTSWNVMLNEFIAGNDLAAAEVLFRRAPEKDVVSWNCMIAGKCGAPDEAMKSFDDISIKSVLAWSAMIVGLAMNGLSREALDSFAQMHL